MLGATLYREIDDRAVAELLRCVDELGFTGVEIGTRVGDLELSDPVFAPFFDVAAQRGRWCSSTRSTGPGQRAAAADRSSAPPVTGQVISGNGGSSTS